jgi:hypothetical protein
MQCSAYIFLNHIGQNPDLNGPLFANPCIYYTKPGKFVPMWNNTVELTGVVNV